MTYVVLRELSMLWAISFQYVMHVMLTFRHRASSILGQAFRYSPENAFCIQDGSNMTGSDFFFFVTINAHHSSNSQTGLNRF